MKSTRKALAMLMATIVIACVGLLSSAQTAQATVWGCERGFSTLGAYVHCSYGDRPSFRANVLCVNDFTASSYVKVGPWKPVGGGSPSIITGCGLFEHYQGPPWAESS